MMFGFACSETKQLMPLPITLAHQLTRRIDTMRETKGIPYLRPDGKSQVSVVYKNGKPIGINNVIIAVPHEENVTLQQVKHDIVKDVVKPILAEYGFRIAPKDIIVNGTGIWHKGGPASDCGLTGRKIVVDTYGGYARVGGGAFSGKEPSKVDRGGAYAARFIAKNIVAHGLAKTAEVRLAYFIGAKKPLMQEVETFGTEKASTKAINDFARKILDTSVSGIIEGLNLLQPIYLQTATYGHFGREEFPWERIGSV
jgi:S-adenosylmethionine synthetase